MLDRCSLKDRRQRKPFAQPVLDQGEQTHRQQGMSSQLKEIVSHSDRSNAQNLLPEMRELAFQGHRGAQRKSSPTQAWIDPAPAEPGGLPSRWASTARLRAARGPQAPCIRAVFPSETAQLIDRESGSVSRPHRPPAASLPAPLPGPGRPPPARPDVAQCRLDFSQFDSKAADLNLMVDATEKLDVSIGPIARQVAGLIQSCSWFASRRDPG